MNTPLTPHIGATLNQRAVMRYSAEQHALEVERAEQIDAAMQVDAMLDRVSLPEPVNFCAAEDAPAPVSPWIFWPTVVTFSLILTFAAHELALHLLPWFWSLS